MLVLLNLQDQESRFCFVSCVVLFSIEVKETQSFSAEFRNTSLLDYYALCRLPMTIRIVFSDLTCIAMEMETSTILCPPFAPGSFM